MDPGTLLKLLGLAVLLAAVLVGGRFVWCLVAAARERRYPVLLLSVAGLAIVIAMLAALVVVWFAYAVAHVEKSASSDLLLFALTVPPYFLVCLVLWWLSGKLLRRLQPGKARVDAGPGSG